MTLGHPLSRRTVLRGAGGAAIALPFLEAMRARRAQAAPPKRFVFFFFSNGVCRDTWTPSGTTKGFTLPYALEPLAPLRKKLVVLQGVNMETARKNPGNGHNVGMTNLLTARRFVKEKDTEFGAVGWGAGPTIDQTIAEKVGGGTKFASLQVGVQSFKSYGANAYSYVSYAGERKPLPNEDDPVKLWNRLFMNAGDSAAAQQARLDKRKSVLDFVVEDYRQLQGRLPADDRSRLDAHLTAVREIQRGLTVQGSPTTGCKRPPLPTTPSGGWNNNATYPAAGKLQMDLLAAALACDLTRVATLQWSSAQSGTSHPWSEVPTAHHPLSHLTDELSITRLKRVQRWYMEQVAYLASALDRIPDEKGTVLDNTILLVGSEVAVGNTHTFVDMPFLILGGGGGAIETERFLRYQNATHNDLYVSLMNAMGIAATSFGDPAFSKGPLAGLVR